MPPIPISPSLNPLRRLLGKSNAGISQGYGAKSFTARAQTAANKSVSPIHALQGKISTIMDTLKKVDPRADRELHQGGFDPNKTERLAHKIAQRIHMDTRELKETKVLIKAMSKDSAANPAATKELAAQKGKLTALRWRQEAEEQAVGNPHALGSFSQTKHSATFQTRGDQIVRGVAGQANVGVAGSITDLTSRRPKLPPSTPKLSSGGSLNSNFRPRI